MAKLYGFLQKYSVQISSVLLFIFVGWSAYIIWQVDRGRKGVNNRIEMITRIGWMSGEFKEIGLYIESDSAQTQEEVDAFIGERLENIRGQMEVLQDQQMIPVNDIMSRVDSLISTIDWRGHGRQEMRLGDMDILMFRILEELDDASTIAGVAIGRWGARVNSYWNQLYFIIFISCILGVLMTWMVKRQKGYTHELEEARDRAEKAARVKSDFLAVMSHEIRTPLNAVIGMSDLVMETDLDEEQKEYARTIKIGGENLLSIINDVLDYSKLESGTVELDENTFELAELIRDVFDLFSQDVAEKRLHVAWEISSSVPREIVADKARLRQVLLNLVGNAMKFTEEGSIELSVQSCGERQDGKHCLRFAVKDSGIGIPEEKLSELFKSFSQVDCSRTRAHGGTGLGLAICKNIVEMMGGDIDVESRAGEGSTFYFTIRVDTVPASVDATQADTISGGSHRAVPMAGKSASSILVVEDNQINQLVTLKVLEKMGYRADVASNGREALDAAREKHYDLILMDLQMPEMDGFESTAGIRALLNGSSHRTKIVAMTADAQPRIRDRCLKSGMDDYLAKPVQMKDLRRTVDKWLG